MADNLILKQSGEVKMKDDLVQGKVPLKVVALLLLGIGEDIKKVISWKKEITRVVTSSMSSEVRGTGQEYELHLQVFAIPFCVEIETREVLIFCENDLAKRIIESALKNYEILGEKYFEPEPESLGNQQLSAVA